MNHCRDCRFWNRNGDPWEAFVCEEDGGSDEFVTTKKQKCLAVLHANGDSVNRASSVTRLAIVTDGSGYAASFWTEPEFGCVMFEKSEP